MSNWQVLINGEGIENMRNISLLDTISGAKKFEILLNGILSMNTINNLDDIEIWSPVDTVDGGLKFDGINDWVELAAPLEMDSNDWAISWWLKFGENWLQGWNKRRRVTLTGGSDGHQFNYPFKLTVTYDSDMQTDFSDIRFADSDGNLLDSWLESKIDSVNAQFYVNFPMTPQNTETEHYYVYYDNSSVSSNWDGHNTFTAYDGFEHGDTTISGHLFRTGSNYADSTYAHNGTYGIKCPLAAADTKSESMGSLELDSFIVTYFEYCQTATGKIGSCRICDDSNNNAGVGAYVRFDGGKIYAVSTIAWMDTGETYSATDWKKVEILQGATTYQVRIDDGAWHGAYVNTFAQTLSNIDRIWLDGEDLDGHFDDIFCTKYVANPATIGWGSDEKNYNCIFCRSKTGVSGQIEIDGSSNIIRVESYTNNHWIKNFSSGITVTDGEWHHYVLDFNSSNSKLYVDGSLTDTETINTDSATFKINYIGYEQTPPNYGDCLRGSLADIRVFDESIDSDEVVRLYNGNYITPCKAFYTMNQSSAEDNAIYDRFEFSHGTSYTEAAVKGALELDTSPLKQFIAFKGQIEGILPDYDTGTVTITGRDYIGSLLKRACVESYTTQLRSYIVNDLVLKYGTNLSRKNINNSVSGNTLSYLFKTSVWDGIVKCAKEDNYRFWVDQDKDFHYQEKGYVDSGITIEVGVDNVLNYNINESTADVINRVTVFGEGSSGTQIVVMVEDLDSQDYYNNIYDKRIVDNSIETEADAITIGEKYLDEHSYILDIIEIDILNYQDLKAGELITLKIPSLSIDDSYLIIEKSLKYPIGINSIRVAKYAKNLEGLIADMAEKILMLERYFIDESSSVTKIHRINEKVLNTDQIIISKRGTNDSFKVGVKDWCVIGKTKIGGRGNSWSEIYNSG